MISSSYSNLASFMAWCIVVPRRAGDSVTTTPAARRASILSLAVPFPPAMIAPAWPAWSTATSRRIIVSREREKACAREGESERASESGLFVTKLTHATARRRSQTSNERHDGLLGLLRRNVRSSLLLHLATDLTDQDDALGLGVGVESLEHVDKVRAVEGVTADTDASALAQTDGGRLCDGLVGQGARARNNAYDSMQSIHSSV